jgi:hypothetical protein
MNIVISDRSHATMDRRPSVRRARRLVAVVVLALALGALGAAPALAAPEWLLDANANTTVAPGATLKYQLQGINIGDEPADGSGGDPIVFEASLPGDLTVSRIEVIFGPPFGTLDWSQLGWDCSGDGPVAPGVVGARNVRCAIAGSMEPRSAFVAGVPFAPTIVAEVAGSASGMRESAFRLSGAGASAFTTSDSTRVTSDPLEFGVESFDGSVTADAAGTAFSQAGGHPYAASTTIDFNTASHPDPLIADRYPVAAPKTLEVDLPPGLVGYPGAAARCDAVDLGWTVPRCPAASQIGTTVVRANPGAKDAATVMGPFAVFNLVPPPGVPARFGFNVSGNVVTLDAQVRSEGDYGVTIRASAVPQGLAFTGTTVTLWGVPAAEAHTPQRACTGWSIAYVGGGSSCSAGVAPVAFIRNPTSCTAPGVGLQTRLRVDSWKAPGEFVSAAFTSHELPGLPRPSQAWGPEVGTTGCEQVPFDPSFSVSPRSRRAGAPSGVGFDLSIPQSDDPGSISQSDLRRAVVTLPEGVRVSASSAQGLGGCSSAQIALRVRGDASCPGSSKIGSVTVETPLLDEPLSGSVYLASPHDNPFKSLLSLYIVARGPGVVVKLPGRVDTDPVTGQLRTTFDDNPQLPFSRLHVELDDGPLAPIALPARCGTYTTHAELTSWSGKTVSIDAPFTVDQDCTPPKFNPGMDAGVANPRAGASSAFSLRLTRDDTDAEIQSVTTRLPEGLLARIGDVTRCTNVAACPAASQIGRVTVGAGAGSNPLFIESGKVFLTNAYKGAPFGLLIRVPAVAGPFDLGDVDVRAALHVDPTTAKASVVADPLPRYLQGIPVLAKDIRVAIDRPGFMVNPTDCTPTNIKATLGSFEGQTANLSNRFQVTDCAALDFSPKLALRLTGRRQTKTGGHPGVKATVTQARGQAAIRKAKVILPKSLALDPDNARALCEFADGTKPDLENHCPKASLVGRAKVTTPLLDKPLTGNVYFVKNIKRGPRGNAIRTLPMIVVALRGQIAINLKGTSSSARDGRLINTFASVPDAPIKAFNLNINGGKNGILTITRTARSKINICKGRHTAAVKMNGQNGKRASFNTPVKTPCAKKTARG